MSDSRHQPTADGMWWVSLLLAVVAAGIGFYLSYVSVVTGAGPAGCGAGSSCAAVLSSRWSRWLGVPVSALATALYLVVVVALLAARTAARRWSQIVLVSAAVSITLCAGWFVYVQAVLLGSWCVYCLAEHGTGLLLAATIAAGAWRHRYTGFSIVIAAITGAIGTAALIGGQWLVPVPLQQLDGVSAQGSHREAGRMELLDGKLILQLDREPIIGPADAERALVLMADYACPHCRHTHHVIGKMRPQYGDRLVTVILPMPMNRACNPYAPESMPSRFVESCELARAALAVFVAEPAQFPAFDAWMFEPATPRSAQAARAEAERLVGPEAFELASNDPRISQMLGRNIAAYGASGADRVPLTLVAGAAPIVGRIEEPDALIELLDRPSAIDNRP